MKIKKKYIILIASVLLIVLCTAVTVYALSEKRVSPLNQCIESEREQKVGYMEKIINEKLNTPLSELPVQDYNMFIWNIGYRGDDMSGMGIGCTTPYLLNQRMGIDNIQKIDDEHIAVVYKITYENRYKGDDKYLASLLNEAEKNCEEVYAFLVFEKKHSDTEDYEKWQHYGEAYFLNEVLTIDDYKNIGVGDSVDELYEIDNSIRYDVLRGERSSNVMQNTTDLGLSDTRPSETPQMVYKLLKDGIMTVEYNYKTMKITEKRYYPYAEEERPWGVSVSNGDFLDCLNDN